MAATECPLCCEQYTQHLRKRVACGYCDTACCSGCLQTYLLTLQSEAQCMSPDCKRAMDGEFLSMHLPRTWLLSKYKAHREKVLLDREMALLPASQEMLANYKMAQEMHTQLAAQEIERRELKKRVVDLDRTIALTRQQLGILTRTNYIQAPIVANIVTEDGGGAAAAVQRQAARQFIRACPVDDCRGFLSTAWKCGTCDSWVCKDCGEPKLEGQRDDQHVCNPDVAASHAMLQRDSRPCPQCAAMIYKLEGCDQMWCTQCNHAFSWRTGAIVTGGVIHNPHYYEWVRRTRGEVPRNPGDVPCGGMPGAYELDAMMRRQAMPIEDSRKLRDIHRLLRHVQTMDLPALRNQADPGVQRNADLRLKYLLNQIDQEEWRRKLQQREKKRERAFAMMQVYEMFVAAGTDCYRGLMQGVSTPRQALDQMQQVQTFGNESLAAISKRFNMGVKRLREH